MSHKFLSSHHSEEMTLFLYEHANLSINRLWHRYQSSHSSFKVCFIGDTVSFETFFLQCEQSKETFAVRYMLWKKSNSANDIIDEICTVYENSVTTVTTIRNWFMSFRAGNFDLKDEGRSGRPAATNITKTMLAENPRYMNVREIMNATNIPKTRIHNQGIYQSI